MRPNGTTRAYEGLTMPERIALAFHYATLGDELEVLRLRDTIPRARFGSPLRELEDGIERWRAIAAHFGINHWRLRALCNEARLAAHIAMNPNLPKVPADAANELILCAAQHEAKLIALDHALDKVCGERGVDPADIRRVNLTEPHRSMMPKLEPDITFEHEVADAMRSSIS